MARPFIQLPTFCTSKEVQQCGCQSEDNWDIESSILRRPVKITVCSVVDTFPSMGECNSNVQSNRLCYGGCSPVSSEVSRIQFGWNFRGLQVGWGCHRYFRVLGVHHPIFALFVITRCTIHLGPVLHHHLYLCAYLSINYGSWMPMHFGSCAIKRRCLILAPFYFTM